MPDDSDLKDLNDDDKLEILRHIAWSMQQAGTLSTNVIHRKTLQAWISAHFEDSIYLGDRRRCDLASREFITVLEQRNYVLCQQGGGHYGFIHRTSLEYLCAAHLIWELKETRALSITALRDDYVLKHVGDKSWREIIKLVAGQLQPADAAKVIEELLDVRINRWDQFFWLRGSDLFDVAPGLSLAIDCSSEQRQRERRRFQAARSKITERILYDSS